MAQIELRLSSKLQKETGICEVLIRFFQGTKFNTRAKSGIFVSPEFFEYYIGSSTGTGEAIAEKIASKLGCDPLNVQDLTADIVAAN